MGKNLRGNLHNLRGFSGGSDGKESACHAGDLGLIAGLGKTPWRKEWLPTPVFLPENSMDRGAWWATVHGVTKSRTRLTYIISKHLITRYLWIKQGTITNFIKVDKLDSHLLNQVTNRNMGRDGPEGPLELPGGRHSEAAVLLPGRRREH